MKKHFIFIFLLFGFTLNGQQLDHVLGDMIVQFNPKISQPAQFLRQYKIIDGKIANWKVKKQLSKRLNIWLIQFDHTSVNEFHILRRLRSDNLVQVAQFNHLLSKRQATPNDPQFPQQWSLLNTGENGGVADADIDMDEAWDITTGGLTVEGDTIVIAVLDEGIDLDHPDLQGNLWKNYSEIPDNGIDDDNNGFIDDFHGWNVNTGTDDVDHEQIPNANGHGTSVAGVIGAVGNNNIFISGINWNIQLMIIAPYGIGSDTEASAIEGYNYALEMRQRYNDSNGEEGAFVVATNTSWGQPNGMPEDAPIWCAFYDELGTEGILTTVATINGNEDIDEVGDLPTTCTSDFLIGVSNSNIRDQKVRGAGFGLTSIDLFAPGQSVPVLNSSGSLGTDSGTSFAAPAVAGVIGLLYAAPCNNFIRVAKQNPSSAALLIRDYLLEGVDVLPAFTDFAATGGRLNAHNSLQLLLEDCGPCPPIFGVDFNGQTVEDELPISWVTDTAILATVRYRILGTTEWLTRDNLISPTIFTNLEACTDYEFQFAAQCEGEPLTFSASLPITVDGCCRPPTTISPVSIDDNSLVVNWPTVVSTSSYSVAITDIVNGNTATLTTSTPSITITDLNPCTRYIISVRPICPSVDAPFSAGFQFETKGCGACTDFEYCSSTGEDASEEWIAEVRLNTIQNITESDDGYGDYTSISTNLTTFSTYDLEVVPGFRSSGFPQFYKGWIDYNQDGIFDNVTEVVFETDESTSNSFNTTITIPETAQLGLTRLRVAMKANLNSVTIAPCRPFAFGEIEDYCVEIITGNFQCLSPQNIQVSGINTTDVQFTWQIGASVASNTIRYRIVNNTEWLEQNFAAGTDILLTDLQECTEYEFQVSSTCTDGSTSAFSDISNFSTECGCSAPQNVQFESITAQQIQISWDPVPSADSYRLFYSELDGSNAMELEVSNTTFTIDNISNCADLNIAITPVCLGERGAITEFPSINICTVSTEELPDEVETLTVFPNPFTSQLNVEIALEATNDVHLSLWSLNGQQVYQHPIVRLSGGEHLVPLVISNLNAGIYLLKIQTNAGIAARRVMIL